MNQERLISVQSARQLLEQNIISLAREESSLIDACEKILAEDVYAPANHPLFNQAAVDGFAVRFEDVSNGNPLFIAGEVKAGEKPSVQVSGGKAVRIFTGAAVPAGADTVLMQEDAEWDDRQVKFHGTRFKRGSNVRANGEQFKKGDVVLRKGAVLAPGAIGLLASLGIGKVKIHQPPKVKLLITGSELVTASSGKNGRELPEGKIFESNGIMLQAALKSTGFHSSVGYIPDDARQLAQAIADAKKDYSILLITGGVSVGNYDFTPAALEQNGINPVFHGVAQKPGKPLLFARDKDCTVFGLPGNPGSVLTCFYVYVLPYLRACAQANAFKPSCFLPLANEYHKPRGKTIFIAAKAGKNGLEILSWQQSYMLRSWGEADGVAELEEQSENFAQGQMIPMHFFK